MTLYVVLPTYSTSLFKEVFEKSRAWNRTRMYPLHGNLNPKKNLTSVQEPLCPTSCFHTHASRKFNYHF
jgi:hypothetical protein